MKSFKNILITGGTGTFGVALVRRLLKSKDVERIILFSRDEMKHWALMNEFKGDERLRHFVGDVRSVERLKRACYGVDLIIHAAAMKIVPLAEYNPIECIRTNIDGAINVIDAALDCNVKKVVALSTDKASSPINLYGATKLASDKLFISSNYYSGEVGARFCVVRYGNVMGSRGSVLPFFAGLDPKEPTPITDVNMTRFMITIEQGIDLVELAAECGFGGEIYVHKIPSMKVTDIARVIRPKNEIKIVGIRPGEKLHEQMIGEEDARNTFDFGNYFKILPDRDDWKNRDLMLQGGRAVAADFSYRSDNNDSWMSDSELQSWFDNYYKK
jgi:UDP-N-acetylglucosamine 4,6-dehydratase